MTRLSTITASLQAKRDELMQMGVMHLGIFGSVARGRDEADSDLDVVVDLDPRAHIGLFRFAQIRERLMGLVGSNVDIVTQRSLQPQRHAEILRDLIRVF